MLKRKRDTAATFRRWLVRGVNRRYYDAESGRYSNSCPLAKYYKTQVGLTDIPGVGNLPNWAIDLPEEFDRLYDNLSSRKKRVTSADLLRLFDRIQKQRKGSKKT